MLEPVTIDQLRVLVAVVEAGSFSEAARRLERAQSGISQAVATLEDQLRLRLFDRTGRRPMLTPEGAAIVEEARAVIARARQLRSRARSLSGGVEASVTLAVSLLVPTDALTDTLGAFETQYPGTDLRLLVQEAAGPAENVLAGRADLGVTGAFYVRDAEDGLRRTRLGSVPIIAIAAAHSRAAHRSTETDPGEIVEEERQLLSGGVDGGATPAISRRTWLVGDQALRRSLVLSGFGWAVMPRHVVAEDIAAGRVVTLDLEARGVPSTETILALHRAAQPIGPAATWIVEALRDALTRD